MFQYLFIFQESGSQCSDEVSPPCELPIALVPVTNASPERRIVQKEIIAGEERPRILSPKLSQDNSGTYILYLFVFLFRNVI